MNSSGTDPGRGELSRAGLTAVVIAVAAAAVVAPAAGVLGNPLWSDETASARVIARDELDEVLGHVRSRESTPPVWYVVAWSLAKTDRAVTGGLLFTPVERLRMVSLLFAGAAAVLTALWAARLLRDLWLAALAGFLVAAGSVPAAYAGQLRAYALLTLLVTTFGLLLVESAFRPRVWVMVALTINVCLGILTHYFFFLTVVAAGTWLWSSRPRLPGRDRTTVAIAIGLLGFLPWLWAFLSQVRHERYAWIGSFDTERVVTTPGSLFFGPEGALFGVARLLVTAAVLVGIVLLWRKLEGRAIIALGALPVLGAAAVWLVGEPVFNERNLLVVVPYIALLVAAAIHGLSRRWIRPVAASGLAAVVLGAAYTQATLGWIAYDRIARALVEVGWRPSDPILVTAPTSRTSLRVPLGWYLPGHPVLVRVPATTDCAARFVIGHSPTIDTWLDRHDAVDEIREFASYDHPFRGRPNGRLVVVRLRNPVDLPESVRLHARSPGWTCPPSDSAT